MPTYQFVRVTFHPTTNHGQLQRIAQVFLEAGEKKAEQDAAKDDPAPQHHNALECCTPGHCDVCEPD